MTGFFARVTGFNFKKELRIARRRISGSNNGRARTSFFGISKVKSSGGAIRPGIGGVIVVDIQLAPN
jgi:malate synthase